MFFQVALPIFQAIANKCFLLGPGSAGTTMKTVVNAILGVGMQPMSGGKAGLSRDVLLEVLARHCSRSCR